ncbi:MAG: hypothetical protein IIT46_05715 [Lachnospiraceae bacterium]|nr:hypothetical protein [Lachnospiraceae bacterium]
MPENELEPEVHEHEHRHHHRKKSKLKSVLYSVMAFFLSFVLFLLSICIVLRFTLLSKNYMLGIMDNKGYYSMVRNELQSRLTDLVHASGFDEEFAVSFANGYDVKNAVENYIDSFYSKNTTLVDTTEFKQQLHVAVEEYAKQKNIQIDTETENNIIYFVNEAASIYVDQISVPFFSTIGKYIDTLYSAVNITTGVLIAMTFGISAVIFFTNRYKHRRFRYLCYGLTGATLATFVIPLIVSVSDKITKVNINTRSLYNLFVGYFTNFFMYFYICAGILAILSLTSFLAYRVYYQKTTSH